MYRAALILILAVPSTAATLRRTVATAAWKSRSLQITTELLTPSERPSTATAPSHKPTNQLSITPTNKPTNRPTDKPTSKPTNEPTNKPTGESTNKPTKQPTDKPTSKPIDMPSGRPTATNEPSNMPTNEPTGKPMKEPTGTPSVRPTKFPSNLPTQKPTNELSNKPTYKPTRESTEIPKSSTNSPTISPSFYQTSIGGDDDSGKGGFEMDNSDDTSPGNENQVTASPTIWKSEIFTESPTIQSDSSRCNDDENFKHEFSVKEVTCKWLRDGAKPGQKNKYCDKTVTYKNESQKVNNICRAACGQQCDNAVEPDGPTASFVELNTDSPAYIIDTTDEPTNEPTIQLDVPTEKPVDDIADEPNMEKIPEKSGSQKVTDSLIDSSFSENSEEEISRADFIGIIL
eukprot:CAMPEP_0194307988 /NCGR_PEP_ID=MMETSP0171-20130528/4906_1 /TAXON_ID=218684 /ORGANISM="Corethron pennatum, Strain L29A3" /LENGTH=401 /DNA_ID=CAMNT_0039060355 /DNA_START=329 /DNA_END=1530 /DNA_ORIENTATION=+